VVFASFDHEVESLDEFLGPDMLHYFDRLFDGRRLKVLGYSRQRIPGNWKLMQENIKDPYHPGLLHTWFVVFGQKPDGETIAELGGRGVENTDHMVTETLIRGMYAYWRKKMEI
jgi:salicylate 5-hydroxylase large subunit